jgi:hypothetical protein
MLQQGKGHMLLSWSYVVGFAAVTTSVHLPDQRGRCSAEECGA